MQERAASWYADNTPLAGGGTLATKLNALFGVGSKNEFLDKINLKADGSFDKVYDFVDIK